MKKVILQACPPQKINIPSPSLTNLKSFLSHRGIDVKIIYWNLIFENLKFDFLFGKDDKDYTHAYSELLFLNYQAITRNDSLLYEKVKMILTSINVMSIHKDPEFIEKHMHSFKAKTDNLICETIEDFNLSEASYFGFSLKMDQWLFASILGDILKARYDKPIIVGGINTKKTAISILKNFRQFDIAVWGEGEYQLLQILNESDRKDLGSIPNIVYRMNDKVLCSKSIGRKYVDLSEPEYLDFSDYFRELKKVSLSKIHVQLPIERSRGCHWGKCHFCYLNLGYRYRVKSLEKLKNEILAYIKEYEIYNFIFLDNDIIGSNLEIFNKFLDLLIEIRLLEPKFRIVSAEIITKGLDEEIVEKMALAGIISVQIGWEVPSDQLLSKIEKKNSFTSNLFFIKVALENNLKITGMNVIANLFEETERDIFEAIQNIKFLRFFRNNNHVYQLPSRLTINSTSKYYQKSKNIDKLNYQPIRLMYQCLSNYISDECAWDIFDFWLPYRNQWWETFDRIEAYYRRNRHFYKLIYGDNQITFREYVNFKEINTFDIMIGSLDFYIFKITNTPVSLEKLQNILVSQYNFNFTTQEIIHVLDDYFKKGLIYFNNDFTEIMSIINVK